MGTGGVGLTLIGMTIRGDPMTYQLTLPKDHPNGVQPVKILDKSRGLCMFKQALEIMENERTVMILLDNNFSVFTSDFICLKLPEDSYIQHHEFHQDNPGASEFVKDQFSKNEKPPKKFLICDWLSSAGYEAPAVIFVSVDKRLGSDIDDHRYATYCQRAKSKLVVYRASNVPFSHEDILKLFGSNSDPEAEEEEIKPDDEEVREALRKLLDNWVHGE